MLIADFNVWQSLQGKYLPMTQSQHNKDPTLYPLSLTLGFTGRSIVLGGANEGFTVTLNTMTHQSKNNMETKFEVTSHK